MASGIVPQEGNLKEREERQSTRIGRGIELWLDRGQEITYYPVAQEYGIPSAEDDSGYYIVSLDDETCECFDSNDKGNRCKHQFAATLWAAKHRGSVMSATPEVRYSIESDHSRYGDEGLWHVVEVVDGRSGAKSEAKSGAKRRIITSTSSWLQAARDVEWLSEARKVR